MSAVEVQTCDSCGEWCTLAEVVRLEGEHVCPECAEALTLERDAEAEAEALRGWPTVEDGPDDDGMFCYPEDDDFGFRSQDY